MRSKVTQPGGCAPVTKETIMTKENVSREDGSTMDLALIPAENGNNTGLVVPEPISGLGAIGMDDLIGPGVGLAATTIGAILANRYGSKIHWMVPEYSGLFGGLFGILCSIPLFYAKDTTSMVTGAVSSAVLGLGLQFIPGIVEQFSGCEYSGLSGLTIQPVGMLPEVQDAGSAPSAVYHQADLSAYGQVI